MMKIIITYGNKTTILAFILVLVIGVLFLIKGTNSSKKLTCIYDTDKSNTKFVLETNKDDYLIKLEFENNFDSIDDAVNKYDSTKLYMDIIAKNEKIQTSIDQNKNGLYYSISGKLTDFTEDYLIPNEIKDVIQFKDIEDFKKHYESLKYQCSLD